MPIVFLLWVYSRTSKAGSVLLAWVSHLQEWHKFQIAAMGSMWTGAAWCLNSTTWTVLSSEVHWNLSSHEEISQCTSASWNTRMKNTWSFHCMSASGSMPLTLLITDVTLQLLDLYAALRFWTALNCGMKLWSDSFSLDWLLYYTGYSFALRASVFSGM